MENKIKEFVSGIGDPIKVLHIMTAAKRETVTDYMHKDVVAMQAMGWTVQDIDVDLKTQEELREILKGVDLVYVQGGNTFYLIDGIRKSGFEKVLREFLECGGRYIGVSAGTLVAGLSIEPAVGEDPNELNMTDFAGMGLIDTTVDVHCEIGSVAEGKICLTDDQAVLVSGDDIKVIEREEI